MRVCACLLLWLWSVTSLAVNFESIPIYTPKPAYPKRLAAEGVSGKVNKAGFQLIPHYVPAIPYPDELQRAGKEGEVLASYTVQANGTVTQVKVLASTHPLLAESAEKTIATWRFKPWVPGADKRSEIEVRAPFRFHMGGEKSALPDSNLILAKIKCSEINNAFKEMDEKWRGYPLAKMRIFWLTEQYLNAPFMTANASAAEIEAMTQDFKSGLFEILNNCRKNPDARYADYLPAQIKPFL